jgi:hypothetical protein
LPEAQVILVGVRTDEVKIKLIGMDPVPANKSV